MPRTRSLLHNTVQKSTVQVLEGQREQHHGARRTVNTTSNTLKERVSCKHPGCNSTVSQRSDLHRHWLRYHATPEESGPHWHYCKYKSEGCRHRDLQKYNLISHYRTHSGEKPFGCPDCSRRFADQSACKRHRGTESCRTTMKAMGLNPLPVDIVKRSRKKAKAAAETSNEPRFSSSAVSSPTTTLLNSTDPLTNSRVAYNWEGNGNLNAQLPTPPQPPHVQVPLMRQARVREALTVPHHGYHPPQSPISSVPGSPASLTSISAASTTPDNWMLSAALLPSPPRPQGRYDPVRDLYLSM